MAKFGLNRDEKAQTNCLEQKIVSNFDLPYNNERNFLEIVRHVYYRWFGIFLPKSTRTASWRPGDYIFAEKTLKRFPLTVKTATKTYVTRAHAMWQVWQLARARYIFAISRTRADLNLKLNFRVFRKNVCRFSITDVCARENVLTNLQNFIAVQKTPVWLFLFIMSVSCKICIIFGIMHHFSIQISYLPHHQLFNATCNLPTL